MTEKKPDDEFDWTQALADWASTTFAPEAPERKRSAAPPVRSRAPSMPIVDPGLLPDLTPRKSVPPPRYAGASPPGAVEVEETDRERDLEIDSDSTNQTRTLYRASSSALRAAQRSDSSPRMVPATPVPPPPPPSSPTANVELAVMVDDPPRFSAIEVAAVSAPASEPPSPPPLPPPSSSAGSAPRSAPGATSKLGVLLGAEPSDDELDALLLGFGDERKPAGSAPAQAPATAKRDSTRPTSPPPINELAAEPAHVPVASSTPTPQAHAPAWPSDEEEPTAIRALPSAELNAMFAAPRAEPTPVPVPAPLLGETDDADSVTAIRAALAPDDEPIEDAVTATKLPTPLEMQPFAGAEPAPPQRETSDTSAPLDSVPGLHIATPPPHTLPRSKPPSTPAASRPPRVISDAPPDSVTVMRQAGTPLGGIAVRPPNAPAPTAAPALATAAAVPSPASARVQPLPRGPAPSDAATIEISSATIDVSELPELEELPGSNPDFDAEEVSVVTGEWGRDRAAAAWLDAAARESFAVRAEWLEEEARRNEDRVARGRALVVVSELYAMLGDTSRAVGLALEARELAPQLPLAHRQLRGLQGSSDGGRFLENIDHSLRATQNPTAKMHDALLAADALRIAGDEEGARKRYEQAARVGAQDQRLVAARAGMALARGDTSSIALRIPEAEGLTPFARAATAALRLRGVEVRGAPIETTPVESVRRARAALEKGDVGKATAALDELANEPSLKQACGWLAAALASSSGETAKHAVEILRGIPDPRAKRWLAARGLELGDPSVVAEALGNQDAFTPPEQLILSLLSGAAADEVRMTNSVVATMPEMAPLAAAASGLRTPLDGHVAGNPTAKREVHLGRLLASDAAPHAIASAVASLATERANEMRALLLDAAHASGRFGEIADAFMAWGDGAPASETMLAAALVAERGGDINRARDAYRALAQEDPSSLLPMRALAALDGERDERTALRARAEKLGTGIEAAVAEIELYARLGATDEGMSALERAAAADPTFAVPLLMLERAARQRGELDRVVAAVRARRPIMTDPMETALDGVREALLVADTEPERAARILLEAHRARPDDVALRVLYERLTFTPPDDRAAWRESRAQKATGTARALWLLDASQLYAHAGDTASAMRVATSIAGSTPEGLARLALEDAELAEGSVSRLSDELMAQAKTVTDPIGRREAYERLAEVDAVGHDASSALLWHRSVLEESPEHLPSLRYLENVLVGEARTDELETLSTTLAKRLAREPGGEGVAHAALSAWLRSRAGEHATVHELAEIVRGHGSGHTPVPLWALRAWNANARSISDHQADYDSSAALLERTQRASEQATLSMRMGDAALRLGRHEEASRAYEKAATLDAGDVSAWEKLVDVRRGMKNPSGAADAMESLARTSQIPAHQLSWWHQAAILWGDEVHDDARARAALEAAAKLDLAHADVFTRLSALYTKAGAKLELASLLEQRSNAAKDENDRLALEVERGRLLTEIGEPSRAREALQAALAIQPDHAAALDALADLCVTAGDHAAAEQAWVRLARLLATPDEQREVYHKLGTLYADHLGNLSRAELSFREVLKRNAGDVPTLERLVAIYSKQNDTARALEIQMELVASSANPIDKRDRMLGLARIYENTSRDLRKAEQTLEAARKELPQDVSLLRALAEFYTRHRQMPAVHILLDRTAGDVRRAVAAGRFAPAAFAIMTTVYELRGSQDAAALVGASLAAIEGRPTALAGAEARAGNPELDDLLAPELISPALRALLSRSGEALDVLAPVDLKSLRAAALPTNHPLVTLATAIAHGMGLPPIQVHVSAQLGMMCVPVTTTPPAIVVGESLVQTPLAAARGFLFVRALKLVQARCGALVRIAPKDAAAAIGGYFRVFNPSWEPPDVPAPLVAEAMRRLQAAMPRRSDADAGLLALEAAGSIFQQPQNVAPALLAWANRAALLAVGDPNAALDAMAWSAGMPQGAPSGEPRSAWITRTPEARELLVFSMSDAYAEARKRCGLAKK